MLKKRVKNIRPAQSTVMRFRPLLARALHRARDHGIRFSDLQF